MHDGLPRGNHGDGSVSVHDAEGPTLVAMLGPKAGINTPHGAATAEAANAPATGEWAYDESSSEPDGELVVVEGATGEAQGGTVAERRSAARAVRPRRRLPEYLRLDTDGIVRVVWQRVSLLVGLLLLQSISQFILEMYEHLISRHVIIPLFLTMLIGAGGNAGNQATVRAITGVVSREFRPRHYLLVLRKELVVGVINATILAGICFARVYYFYGSHDLFWSTVAITISLFCIVVTSIVLGTTLPFFIGAFGFDREHAAPIIQVLMDITGVFITCAVCTALIPEREATHAPPAIPTPPPPR